MKMLSMSAALRDRLLHACTSRSGYFLFCVVSNNADKAPMSKMRQFIKGKTVKHSSLLAVIALCTPMRESNRL